MPKVQHIEVTSAEDGQKLFQFLDRRLQGEIPRSALMRWIRTGQVRIDRSRSKPFTKVHSGQLVRVAPYSRDNLESAPVSASGKENPFLLRTVYEDFQVLVLAKPSNLPSQPGKKQKDSVSERIKHMYANSDWVPALVHRLDKDTSGLLLLAKTYNYLQYLQNIWSGEKVRKIYLAWVNADTNWSQWSRIKDVIYQKRDSEQYRVTAISSILTLERRKGMSLLAVGLHTGRKHQIRIQLQKRGLAIIGDQKYNAVASGQGLLLHAWHLSWDNYSFTLPPPWIDHYRVSPEIATSVAGILDTGT